VVEGHQQLKVARSQKYFNRLSLFFYDFILYRIVSRFAWGCPTSLHDSHYAGHISNNHLDVGVGTGYLLHRAVFSSDKPRLALMDLSVNCLNKAGGRLKYLEPEFYEQNILIPISERINKFNSIGVNSVMHCIPGSFKEKSIAFKYLSVLLNDEGVLFGSTVLYSEGKKNVFSDICLWLLNGLGVFNNLDDNVTDLRVCLDNYFDDVDIRVVGTTALFSVRGCKV
jgi:hypothetical protein